MRSLRLATRGLLLLATTLLGADALAQIPTCEPVYDFSSGTEGWFVPNPDGSVSDKAVYMPGVGTGGSGVIALTPGVHVLKLASRPELSADNACVRLWNSEANPPLVSLYWVDKTQQGSCLSAGCWAHRYPLKAPCAGSVNGFQTVVWEDARFHGPQCDLSEQAVLVVEHDQTVFIDAIGTVAEGQAARCAEDCTLHTQCNDDIACTADACLGGQCINREFANCCETQADCDDGDPCTEETCTNTRCEYTRSPECCDDHGDCDDGIACTLDRCDPVSGKCAHTPYDVVCGGGDGCTTQVCSATAGCVATVKVCDDGDPCTTDTCSGGSCTTGPPTCDDGVACTQDFCDPVSGACLNLPQAAQCPDSTACTISFCGSGGCETEPVVCDDGLACTTDSCDVAAGGCQSTNNCDDGHPCTADVCNPVDGQCIYAGVDSLCADGSGPCLVGACTPGVGCEMVARECDDGLACTSDGCSMSAGCVHSDTCDDGDSCTDDYCSGDGECTHVDNGSCEPEPPEDEVCDGVDNDQDGLTDEGFDADGDGVARCCTEGQHMVVAHGGTVTALRYDPVAQSFVDSPVVELTDDTVRIVAVADLDADGRDELLWQRVSNRQVTAATCQAGEWQLATSNIASGLYYGGGDVNGDGCFDLVGSGFGLNTRVSLTVYQDNGQGSVGSVALGDCNGGFTELSNRFDLQALAPAPEAYRSYAIDDVDGDGLDDVLWSAVVSANHSRYMWSRSVGDGSFEVGEVLTPLVWSTGVGTMADLDGDGCSEWVGGPHPDNSVGLATLRLNCDGVVAGTGTVCSCGTDTDGVGQTQLYDWNGDGHLDLMFSQTTAGQGQRVTLRFGSSSGEFGPESTVTAGHSGPFATPIRY